MFNRKLMAYFIMVVLSVGLLPFGVFPAFAAGEVSEEILIERSEETLDEIMAASIGIGSISLVSENNQTVNTDTSGGFENFQINITDTNDVSIDFNNVIPNHGGNAVGGGNVTGGNLPDTLENKIGPSGNLLELTVFTVSKPSGASLRDADVRYFVDTSGNLNVGLPYSGLNKEGDYEIKVSSGNGASLGIRFRVVNPNKLVSLELDYGAETFRAGSILPVPNITAAYPDGRTVVSKYDAYTLGDLAVSISDASFLDGTLNSANGTCKLRDDKSGTITMTVVDRSNNLFAQQTLTIEESASYLKLTPDFIGVVSGEVVVVSIEVVDRYGNFAPSGLNAVSADGVIVRHPVGANPVIGAVDTTDFKDGRASVIVGSHAVGDVTIQIVIVEERVANSGGRTLTGTCTVSFQAGDQNTQNISIEAIENKVYGDAAFSLSITPDPVANLSNFSYYSVYPDVADIDNDGTITIHSAGTTDVIVMEPGNETFGPFYWMQAFTVTKAPLEVKTVDTSIIYGEPVPQYEVLYTGFAYGENEMDLVTMPALAPITSGKLNVGEYVFRASGAASDNYDFTYVDGKLTVSPKEVTVSGLSVYDKEYTEGDTSAVLKDFGYTIDGVLSGDDIDLDMSSLTAAFDDDAIGEGKNITISGIALTGADKGNYKLTATTATTTADIKEELSSQDVAAMVSSVKPLPRDATQIDLPVVPAGFSIAIKSSDNAAIGTSGNVALMDEDTTVTLVLTVTKIADGSSADTAEITVTVLAATQYSIAATARTGGSAEGSGTYKKSATVVLTATPDSRYTFEGWYENNAKIAAAGATYSFTAEADRTLEARFTYAGGGGGGGGGGSGSGSSTVSQSGSSVKEATSSSGKAVVTVQDSALTELGAMGRVVVTVSEKTTAASTLDRLAAVDPVNRQLAAATYTIATTNNGQRTGDVYQQYKMSVDVSGATLTVAQKEMLTGIYYDAGTGTYKNLGGELSADGKTLTFYSSKAGDHGVMVSNNLQKVVFSIGSEDFTVNGQNMQNDVAPLIQGGRTLLPVRVISETLGADVSWDNATRTVTVIKDGQTVNVVIDQALPGGLGTAVISDGRTMVPIRYVAQMLDCNIFWDDSAKSVKVYA